MFKQAGQAQFDKLLEKATSNLLLEPDWTAIMQINDLIRQKDCQPKYAVAGIRKKLNNSNPHIALFGLQVLESLVKNCGSPVHEEIATKPFMEDLRELAKSSTHENVREKVLELVQTWAHAFRNVQSYRAVQDVLNIMKAEGAKFPPLVETDAMFVADTAPEWADGECCNRCRVEFNLMVRKHHCRACGQIFCSRCSSKLCTLPRFGIEKEVRVCDSCYDKHAKINADESESQSQTDNGSGMVDDPEEMIMRAGAQPPPKAPTAPSGQPRGKTEEELQEEEQLQLAIAISQSEAEAKEYESKHKKNHYAQSTLPSVNNDVQREQRPLDHSSLKSDDDDPELARYLNRNYWEQRGKDDDSREETGVKIDKNSATGLKTNYNMNSNNYSFLPSAPVKENKDKTEQAEDIDMFGESLRGQIEMFVNRMKSNSSRGRPISYDTSVQALFMNITQLHSQLLNYIQMQDNARAYYEGLQDKLSQVKDARGALDALREEHSERLRQQAEEAERVRQMQMAQKLHVMRQKKQEYLQYQRQLAMQRMQEQEREMQMRIEQQKQQSFGFPPPGQYPGYPHPGYMGGVPQPGGPEMAYMGPPPPGQFMPPPNTSVGGQAPGQLGGYPPPGAFMGPPQPGTMVQPNPQIPGQPHQPGPPPVSAHNQPQISSQQAYYGSPVPQHPQSVAPTMVTPPNSTTQADMSNPNVGIVPLKNEPSTAELISFD